VADMTSKIEDHQEGFPIDNSQRKRPVKLRHQILEARKSTSAIETVLTKRSIVPVAATEPTKRVASKDINRSFDKKPSGNLSSTTAKLKPKTDSIPAKHSILKARGEVSRDSEADKPALTSPQSPILTKEESTASMEYKDDFHEESVHEGDTNPRISSASSSPVSVKANRVAFHEGRKEESQIVDEKTAAAQSVDSDEEHPRHAYTERIITVSKRAPVRQSSEKVSSPTNNHASSAQQAKLNKAPSVKYSEILAEANDPGVDENLPVEDGLESSNDLILSRSISVSGDFAMMGNVIHGSLAANLSEAIKTSMVPSPSKGKGVAEDDESVDDIGDISVTDEVTITWNNARNIRLQSISTVSHESVVEDINLSALTSAKSSRSPSAKSLTEHVADFPVSPLSNGAHDNHISGLKAASYSSTITTSTSSLGSINHESLSNKHTPSEKGHKLISTILEESSPHDAQSPKTSPRLAPDYRDNTIKYVQPFSPEASMHHESSDIPTLEIVKTTLFPDPGPISAKSSIWSQSAEGATIEQSFATYDRNVGSSQRRLSIKISASLLSVAEAVALAVNDLDHKTPSSISARSNITSSLPTTREPLVQSIPEDEPKSADTSPTSIEAAFMNLDRMQGGSERRLSTKSNSARGENSVDYSNLPSYMRPTASQSVTANAGSGKSSRQASFRGSSSRTNSSSRLNLSAPPEYISPVTMASPLSATSPSIASPNTLSYSISMDANGSASASPLKMKSPSPIAISEGTVEDNLPVEEQKSSKTVSIATPDSSAQGSGKRTPISEVPFIIRSTNSARFKNSSKSPARSPARTPSIRSPARSPAQSPNSSSKQSSPKINTSTPDKRSAGKIVEYSPWADAVSPSRSSRKILPDSKAVSIEKGSPSPTATIDRETKTPSPTMPSSKQDLPSLSVEGTCQSDITSPSEKSSSKSSRTPRIGRLESGQSKSVSISEDLSTAPPSRENVTSDQRVEPLPLTRQRSYNPSSGYDSAYSPSEGTMTRDMSYLSRYSSRLESRYDESNDHSYYSNTTSARSEIRPYTGKK
jgi:hypothetical protein